MRCDEAQSQLRLGRAESADAELDAHVRGCASCQALAQQQGQLDVLLALDQPHAPGPGFDTRFFARLEGERAVQKKKRAIFSVRMWLWALVPAAAGVALLVSRSGQAPPEAQAPAALMEAVAEPDDLDLVQNLELIEELDVVRQLDELEDFDLLETIEPAELERLAAEVEP